MSYDMRSFAACDGALRNDGYPQALHFVSLNVLQCWGICVKRDAPILCDCEHSIMRSK
jgi:hypothetical protein